MISSTKAFQLLGRRSGPSKSQGNALSPFNLQIPKCLGKLVNYLGKNERKVNNVDFALLWNFANVVFCLCTYDESKYLTHLHHHSSYETLQHHLPTLSTLLYHFLFFIRVHLDWQTLINLFFFYIENLSKYTLITSKGSD